MRMGVCFRVGKHGVDTEFSADFSMRLDRWVLEHNIPFRPICRWIRNNLWVDVWFSKE